MKSIILYSLKYNVKNLIILFILASVIMSCSLADFYSNGSKDILNTDVTRKQNTSYTRVKCPIIIIPKETSKYVNSNYNKKFFLNIEKVQIICKELKKKDGNKVLLIDFKVNINMIANFELNIKNKTLPKIYLAIIEKKYEKLLTKILSKTNLDIKLKPNQSYKLINKGKLKIKHNNELDNLNLYLGFQKSYKKSNKN